MNSLKSTELNNASRQIMRTVAQDILRTGSLQHYLLRSGIIIHFAGIIRNPSRIMALYKF